MIDGNQNIEQWFLDQPKEKFPSNFNYAARYIAIKEYMNDQIHPEIKSMVRTFIPDMYLNDHGEKHIRKVIIKASEIIDISQNILSPYETFFLLVAIQIHDAGHLINGRKEHEKNAKNIVSKFGNELIDSVEKRYISAISRVHSGKDDPIGNLKEKQLVNGERINLKLIAAILRLADELADDATRASLFLLENELLSEKSELFHEYSKCLHSCVAESDSHEIKMNFYIQENLLNKTFSNGSENVFLLDEIYNRSLKTYLECIYCNRYLHERFRYTTVNVDIEIESENELISPKLIPYRIMEKGYPELKSNSIFEICDKELITGGKLLDGKYYSELIQNVLNHEKSI